MGIGVQIDMARRPHGAGCYHVAKALVDQLAIGHHRLKGILAAMHGGGARVVLRPVIGDAHIADAHDICHHAHRLRGLEQPGALFDVTFDKAAKAGGVYKTLGQMGHAGARLAKGGACAIGQRIGLIQAQAAGPDGAAGGHAKTALFILEIGHGNGGAAGLGCGLGQF